MKGSPLISRPYGTQLLFPNLFPALKCWAKVKESLTGLLWLKTSARIS
jgi:hypothetical protein